MAAMSIDSLTLIHTIRLSIRMIYMNYHRMLERSDRCYGFYFLAGEFISFKDRFFIPISPVHVILEGCYTERMSKALGRV